MASPRRRVNVGDPRYVEGTIKDVVYDRAAVAAPVADRARRLGRAGLGAAQIASVLPAAPLLRHWYNRWGASREEAERSLPGDERVPRPQMSSTRAITIDAPPTEVWPWLAQIGQGRGGFYSYDELENLVGCDIHSTDQILAEFQRVAVGDVVRLAAKGGPSYRVDRVQPPDLLVLAAGSTDPTAAESEPTDSVEFAATWQWLLQPVSEGARTRLVVRQRFRYPRPQSIMWHLVEPVNFVMERRMLYGMKSRAEVGAK